MPFRTLATLALFLQPSAKLFLAKRSYSAFRAPAPQATRALLRAEPAGGCGDLGKLVESECEQVAYDANPVGCQCSLGGKAECPLTDGLHPLGAGMQLSGDAQKLGFYRLSSSSLGSSAATGGVPSVFCMYWLGNGDYLATDPDVIAANVETEVKRSKDLTDKAEKWANGVGKANSAWQWGFTAPPSPHDEFGTPTCWGWCTTPTPQG